MTDAERIQKLEEYLARALNMIPSEQRVERKYIHVDEAAGSTWEEIPREWLVDAWKLLGKEARYYF